MNPLQLFYQNENQREAVRAFLIESLGEIAKDRAFDGKDTKGIQEAHECIGHMFDALEVKYGIIKKPMNSSAR